MPGEYSEMEDGQQKGSKGVDEQKEIIRNQRGIKWNTDPAQYAVPPDHISVCIKSTPSGEYWEI